MSAQIQANQESPRNFYVTPVFHRNLAATATTVVNVGGAGSSKSYSSLQQIVAECSGISGQSFLIMRKTMPALRMTTMRDFFTMLKEYRLYNSGNHNKTENTYYLNGNLIQFAGLDDVEKIKSSAWNKILLEEANEFTWDDYLVLLTRLRGKVHPGATRNQIRLNLNPSDAQGWIPKNLPTLPDVQFIHSTYRDNPFLDAHYVGILEGLKAIDYNHYRIYALGEWGVLKGRIYSRFDFFEPSAWPANLDDEIYAVDFGYNDPSVLLRIGVKDHEAWIRELIYKSKLTTGAFAQEAKALVPERERSRLFRCDSAEPDRIAELVSNGFNAVGVEKGPGSVKSGIDYCLGWKLHISTDSPFTKKEIEAYCWKLNKAGEPTDEPIGFNDHSMSGLRYGLTYFRREGAGNTPSDIKSGSAARNVESEYERALANAAGESSFEEGLI